MPTFRVHYEYNDQKQHSDVDAENPLKAANIVRKNYTPVIILKTKLLK